MAYSKVPICTANPGRIIILVDQSESMGSSFDNGAKAGRTALAVNRVVNELVLACQKDFGIEPESTDGYRAFADAWRAVIDLAPEEKTAHRGFADACLAIGDSQTSDNALQGCTQT